MIEPGTPLTDAEREVLGRIGARSPCTQRWLEHWLPARRYYVALGTLIADAARYGHSIQGRAIILRLKDCEGFQAWCTRDWFIFVETPRIIEATLITLRFIEEIVARPARASHRLTFRGYVDAAGALTLRAHLADDDPCVNMLYDGRRLFAIEAHLRREGVVSPELPGAIPFCQGADFPWKLREARPSDGSQRGAGGSVYRDYVPSGCAIED